MFAIILWIFWIKEKYFFFVGWFENIPKWSLGTTWWKRSFHRSLSLFLSVYSFGYQSFCCCCCSEPLIFSLQSLEFHFLKREIYKRQTHENIYVYTIICFVRFDIFWISISFWSDVFLFFYEKRWNVLFPIFGENVNGDDVCIRTPKWERKINKRTKKKKTNKIW